MKTWKHLSLAGLLAIAVFAVGFAFTACGGDTDSERTLVNITADYTPVRVSEKNVHIM